LNLERWGKRGEDSGRPSAEKKVKMYTTKKPGGAGKKGQNLGVQRGGKEKKTNFANVGAPKGVRNKPSGVVARRCFKGKRNQEKRRGV